MGGGREGRLGFVQEELRVKGRLLLLLLGVGEGEGGGEVHDCLYVRFVVGVGEGRVDVGRRFG